jgi:hypothetical protein
VNFHLGEAGSPRRLGSSPRHANDVESEEGTMRQRVRITVRGSLSARLASAFDGMTPRHRRGHTDLVGEIADQAQLHGLLSRIRDLGLELEKVTVLPEPEQPPSPRAQT